MTTIPPVTRTCPTCGHKARASAYFCGACGSRLPAPDTRPVPISSPSPSSPPIRGVGLPTGTLLGYQNRYRIERPLGKGGFGEAYLAADLHLGRPCVVKRMTVDANWSASEQQQAQYNFQREARLLVTLNTPGHPNIPEIYEYLADDHCLVMKYITGRNLALVMQEQGGPLPVEAALRYVRDVCSALTYLHSRTPEPVLHRDIKPDNVLLDTVGRVWLVDFGLAKAAPLRQQADLQRMDTTSLAGTLGFTPPEQWAGASEPRSDVYALAATLHLLLTSYQPARTEVLAMIRGDGSGLPPVQQFNRQIPLAIEQLIARSMRFQASERPTAQEFLDVLESVLAQPDLPPPPTSASPPQTQAFVGRVRELAELGERLSGRGSAVLAGPAGVGKTTLAAAMARRFAHPDRVFWHTLRPDESVERVFWALAAHLANQGFDQVWRRLHQQSLSGALPALTLIGDYLVDLLIGKGYLLVLDDAHLGETDAAFVHFVRRIYEAAQAEHVQLIATVRRAPAWATREVVQTLEGLQPAEVAALLDTQQVQLSETQRNQLYAHTEGNPKFLLLACNALQRGDDPEQLVHALAQAGDIAEYLIAEVHRLLDEQEQTLMGVVAALLDQPASRDAIEYMLDADDLWDQLNQLSRSYMLSVSAGPQGPLYSQHSLVQRFYYQRQGLRRRQKLHQRAGEFYEREERNVLLAARHYTLAGEFEQAARIVVGEVGPLLNQGAAGDLAAVLRDLPLERLPVGLSAGVLTARGEVALLQAEYANARSALEQALDYGSQTEPGPGQISDQARRYRLLAMVDIRNGHYERAEENCLQGLALAEALGQPNSERARLYAQRADVLFRQGEYEQAEAACQTGLSMLPPAPAAPRERALILQRLATIVGNRGEFSTAIQQLEAMQPLVRRVGDPLLLSVVLNNLGIYLHFSGEHDRALNAYDEALRLKDQTGDVHGRIQTMMNMGLVHQALGEPQAALERYLGARDLGRRIEAPETVAVAALNSGRIYYEQGDRSLAHGAVAEAEAIFRRLGDDDGLADSLCVLGDIALLDGDPHAAERYGNQALQLAEQVGNRVCQANALRVIGSAQSTLGIYANAEANLSKAWQLQQTINDPYDQALILTAQAALANIQGKPEQARELARAALALAREQGIQHIMQPLETIIAAAHLPPDGILHMQ
jgi:ATP/maltotriose-dependent transcriptional regulator MalT/tRNA A-37 threonylcarbamoyl transferase component Bud32